MAVGINHGDDSGRARRRIRARRLGGSRKSSRGGGGQAGTSCSLEVVFEMRVFLGVFAVLGEVVGIEARHGAVVVGGSRGFSLGLAARRRPRPDRPRWTRPRSHEYSRGASAWSASSASVRANWAAGWT